MAATKKSLRQRAKAKNVTTVIYLRIPRYVHSLLEHEALETGMTLSMTIRKKLEMIYPRTA